MKHRQREMTKDVRLSGGVKSVFASLSSILFSFQGCVASAAVACGKYSHRVSVRGSVVLTQNFFPPV